MNGERIVGGLRCGEVLERLSDYLDGDADAPTRARIEEHLRGCEGCARFGGELSATIRALREHLLGPARAPESVRRRLLDALREDDR